MGWLGDKKPEEWIIVEGMHEPIIDRETFDLVQEKVKSRKRPTSDGKFSLFAGLLKCGQCGSTMRVRLTNQKERIRIYSCSKYARYGVKHCTQHRIDYDVLYDIVLREIRSCARHALADEHGAIEELRESSQTDAAAERSAIERSIAEGNDRLAALDRVVGKLYEDVTTGRISEDNFNRILSNSQKEQETLKGRLALAQERLSQMEKEDEENARWLEMIKEYADIQELDEVTLNRLIQKIVIHEDKDGDELRQTVEIFFNFSNNTDKQSVIRT